MASTTANNNSTSSSQPAQFSFTGPRLGSTPPLASLANAPEPSGFSFDPQQTPVGTFPQRTTGGSSTANTGSPVGAPFSQGFTSGPIPSFQFTNSSSTNASTHSFANPSPGNVPRFSFNNLQSGNPSNSTFTQPTTNPQVQQPSGSVTITSSKQKQEISNDNLQSSAPLTSTHSSQQIPAGNFPQRTAGGSSTANTGSPFGASFSQGFTSGPIPSVQFTNSSSTNASTHSFANPSSANVPRFSFNSLQSGNPSNSTFTQPTANAQVRQPLGSFTITPSKQKQEISNDNLQASAPLTSTDRPQQIPVAGEVTRSTINNAAFYQKKLSDPPTPISEQSSPPNQEQEEADAPSSLAEDSLLLKKINTTLQDSDTFVVDRSDQNSPLHSTKTFQELNLKPDLLKGVYSMGFRSPSKIQEIALPSLLANPPRNIIAQSQSGTGKTAAFSLAIISRIDPSIRSSQALILAPTFELAVQIGSVIEKMAQFLPYIRIAYAVRDPAKSKRKTLVRGQYLTEPIIIGTPGTVEEWCRRLHVIDLSQLCICCVDEADVLIATEGFQRICVDLVHGLDSSSCQMMLFSATYSDEVMGFAREIVPNPLVLRLKREKQALNNIRQYFIRCYDSEMKYYAIDQIYTLITVGQAMIFCRTKKAAQELAVRMANQKHSVRFLTGDLEIEQRASIIQQFRDGIFRVLISTNVTSRGLDITDVSLVINYDMPVTTTFKPDYETYLHRIGRCGRFGQLGYTFNLIGSEKDLNIMNQIEQYFNHPISEITIEAISNLEADQE